jgi:hypothetical protein
MKMFGFMAMEVPNNVNFHNPYGKGWEKSSLFSGELKSIKV